MPRYDGSRVAWNTRLVRTGRVEFGRVRYQPGGYCGPRRQRDFELVVIQAGAGAATVDGTPIELPPDQAALFLPGHREHFAFSPAEETLHVWCSLRPDFMPPALGRRLSRAPRLVPCSELMHRLFAAAQGFRRIASPEAGSVVEHLGLALFAEFLNQAENGPRQAGRDEALNRATAYIEDHFGEEGCLDGARTVAHCSLTGLNQQFRRYLGTTPARFVWAIRIERGVAMLRNTGLTAAEISARCGFKNPFHFSRLVKRSQGVSPREVRRRAWQ